MAMGAGILGYVSQVLTNLDSFQITTPCTTNSQCKKLTGW